MAGKILCWLLFGWLKYSLAGELVNVQNEIENNISVQTKTADCINKIVSKYFSCGSNIKLFSSREDFSYLYTNIINSGNCYKVGYTYSNDWIWTHDGYIVYTMDLTTFHKTMTRIRKDKRWNPKAKYVVKVKESLDEVKENEIFSTFLNLNIFDVVVLQDKNDKIEVSTYYYIANGTCWSSIASVTSFGNCDNISEVNLFPDKLSSRNCTITVAVSEDPPFTIFESNQHFQFLDTIEGLEQYILSNIGRLVNISINYIMVPPHVRYGVVLQNGSYTGSLVYLQNKTAEIVAGAFMLIKNRAEVFDFIAGYSYPTYKVYSSAHKEETWKSVYKPFGQTTWALIILSYIVFSTVIIVLSYLITGNNDYVKTFLRVLGYFYGNVDNNLIRVTKLRRFMIIWIFFTLLTCAFYNTAFYSIITGKKRTITPVIDKQYISFLTPCISETILTLFKYTYNETLVTDTSPNCRYVETSLDTVAKSSNLYTIYMDYSYKFGEYKYIDKDGNKKLDTWDYPSFTILTMYASKGFPLSDVFRKYILQFVESGLVEKHLNDIYFKSQLLKVNPVRRFVAVTLSDCRVHFGVLLFGVVLSVICFIIELNKRQIN